MTRRFMRHPRMWPLATLLILVASGAAPLAEEPAAEAPDLRLLVVGLDGADWQIAAPLIDAGRLPHLGRLRKEGS